MVNIDYEKIWITDKLSMMNCMTRNMESDLKTGYNPTGQPILKQIEAINAYRAEYENQLMLFAEMDDKQVNRWCKYDLIRRGAIEP